MSIKQRNKNNGIGNIILNKNIKVAVLGKEDEKEGGSRFTYALWREAKKKLEKKGFKIEETIIDNPNYDEEVENLGRNKYDLLVGYISVISRRAKLGNYTQPLVLDQHVIVFEPGGHDSYKDSYLYQLLLNIATVAGIFLVSGVLFSALLYFFGNHYSSQKKRLKWHFWGVFGALLGEPVSIVERIDVRNISSLAISFFILLFMFIASLLFEAMLTRKVVEDDISAEKDPIGTDIKG